MKELPTAIFIVIIALSYGAMFYAIGYDHGNRKRIIRTLIDRIKARGPICVCGSEERCKFCKTK